MPAAQPAPLPLADLHSALTWRYATKKYDATRKIPAASLAALEETLVLSASSYGLQPYRFYIVDDPAVRARLQTAAYGQTPFVEASHLVVFAAKKGLDESYVEHFIARVAEVRGVPAETLKGYRDTIIGDLVKGPRHDWVDHWAARQAYIALGDLLTSAALLGIDATPMEGFQPPKVDEILGLAAQGYGSVVCAALGYRHPDDKYAKAPKVRFPAGELITHV